MQWIFFVLHIYYRHAQEEWYNFVYIFLICSIFQGSASSNVKSTSRSCVLQCLLQEVMYYKAYILRSPPVLPSWEQTHDCVSKHMTIFNRYHFFFWAYTIDICVSGTFVSDNMMSLSQQHEKYFYNSKPHVPSIRVPDLKTLHMIAWQQRHFRAISFHMFRLTSHHRVNGVFH